MIKVAMIGAGSVVFSKRLTIDILNLPEFKHATLAYMDVDRERLDVAGILCRNVAKALNCNPKIVTTTNRQEAVEGADFVINMVQVGGFDSTLVDFEIPRKYGLNFVIGDTTGPSGLFRALRTYPMLVGLCQDMEKVCQKAVLLNYTNPMSMNMQSIYRTSSVQAVGLCHSVQSTLNLLMRIIKEDPEKVSFVCAGINHMAFYTRLEKDGVDLYPRLFEAMQKPEIFKAEPVRFELMKRLGHFVTESSNHNSEYNPYFIPHGKESIEQYAIPLDELLRVSDTVIEEFNRTKASCKSKEPMIVHKSDEYGSTIIHSIVNGTPSVIYGNMPNNGAISNLPDTAIVETATLVDRSGLHFTRVGELPPQLVGYIQPHITQHELFIRAAMEARRDHIYQAAMFDPLTAAILPLDKIVDMCDELIEGHGALLPPLKTRTLIPGSGKRFNPPTPRKFREKWDAAAKKSSQDCIREWCVIGPFPGKTEGKVSLDMKTAVEDDFIARGDGGIDSKATYKVDSRVLKWKKATADAKGFVDLDLVLGRREWAVAYAYAELESTHARETELRCGSDDGIKIWLNGEVVHHNEVGRWHITASDKANIYLKAGINKFIVKIDNYVLGWGFSVFVSKALF